MNDYSVLSLNNSYTINLRTSYEEWVVICQSTRATALIHFVMRRDMRTNATSCYPQHQKGLQIAVYLYSPKVHVLIWHFAKVLKG